MFEEFLISRRATLRDALITMTTHHRGLLFIVDSTEDRLIGVLSDGDIRRALLQNSNLDSPIEQWMNLNPTKANSEKEAKKILSENPYLLAIPIISQDSIINGICYTEPAGNILFLKKELIFKSNTNEIPFIAIIPARGGSKRIPKKNLAKLGKHSLLGWAIINAQQTQAISEIIVSTDDPEIATEAAHYGVKVHSLRPSDLASDTTKTIDVIKYEIEHFESANNIKCNSCILLEPTAPLRSSELLSNAIQMFSQNDADSLVSVTQLRHNFHPEEILRIVNGNYLSPFLRKDFDDRKGRQDQEPLYVQNGLIYITKCSIILNQNSLYGQKVLAFNTGENSYLDIDNSLDLEIANLLISKK